MGAFCQTCLIHGYGISVPRCLGRDLLDPPWHPHSISLRFPLGFACNRNLVKPTEWYLHNHLIGPLIRYVFLSVYLSLFFLLGSLILWTFIRYRPRVSSSFSGQTPF